MAVVGAEVGEFVGAEVGELVVGACVGYVKIEKKAK